MQLNRSLDTYIAMYNFAVDGGAIGTIDLGTTIPGNSSILECGIIVAGLADTGVGASITVDLINNGKNPVVITLGALYVPTLIAALVASPVINFAGGVYPEASVSGAGLDPFTATFTGGPPEPLNIGLSISLDTLVAGKIIIIVRAVTLELGI